VSLLEGLQPTAVDSSQAPVREDLRRTEQGSAAGELVGTGAIRRSRTVGRRTRREAQCARVGRWVGDLGMI
jgi:hypothetical protein